MVKAETQNSVVWIPGNGTGLIGGMQRESHAFTEERYCWVRWVRCITLYFQETAANGVLNAKLGD
jgi:hypothetical protein